MLSLFAINEYAVHWSCTIGPDLLNDGFHILTPFLSVRLHFVLPLVAMAMLAKIAPATVAAHIAATMHVCTSMLGSHDRR